MTKRIVRIVLNDETFRKYKVYCAISNLSMTDQTNLIIKKFVDETESVIKIIKVEDKK